MQLALHFFWILLHKQDPCAILDAHKSTWVRNGYKVGEIRDKQITDEIITSTGGHCSNCCWLSAKFTVELFRKDSKLSEQLNYHSFSLFPTKIGKRRCKKILGLLNEIKLEKLDELQVYWLCCRLAGCRQW